MPTVAALYRYPVKGFTPEIRETLTVLPGGQIAGDRVLGVRFADSPAADDKWSTKHQMLVLVNTPGLATLNLTFDGAGQRLTIRQGNATLVDASLDGAGRDQIAAALAEFVLGLEESPLRGYPERLPLRLIGDGQTPRYHDNADGQVSLHGRASIHVLGAALGDPDHDELRYRSNISVEGLEPWEELSWIGRRVSIGALTFRVVKEKVRCLATHANPASGERDQPVMTTLVETFGHERPMMGVALVPMSGGGEVRVGDPVRVQAS